MPASDPDHLSCTLTHKVVVSIESPCWSQLVLDINTLINQVVSRVLQDTQPIFEVGLILADDDLLQQLNRDYLHKDKPTNVLSFESGARQELLHMPDVPHIPLGDIFLSYTTILREASEQNKTFEHHLTHLVCHGLLHLLGHDHVTDAEAEVMEGIEIQVLDKLGIGNPYSLEYRHDF